MKEPAARAAYVWNWNSLVGCVQGVLQALALPADAARVSGTLGEAFRVGAPLDPPSPGRAAFQPTGYQPRPLPHLAASLAALGLGGRMVSRDLGRERRPWRLGHRIRGALDAGRPVIAYGAGVPDFVLLTGRDRDALLLSGPLTEQIGPRLTVEALPNVGPGWLCVIFPTPGTPDPVAAVPLAARHALAADAPGALRRWLALLESDTPMDPQAHASWAAGLAAARVEAAAFWEAAAAGADRAAVCRAAAAAYRDAALALSRFTTLFPYPAGGDARSADGRRLGARALAAALPAEARALATLADGFPAAVP